MHFSRALVALLTATLASAQFENIPGCSLQCLLGALQGDGCSSVSDFVCHCQKPELVGTITPCVKKACNAADQAVVSSVVVAQCSSIGHPISVPPVAATEAPTSTPAKASTGSGSMSLPTTSSFGSARPSSQASSASKSGSASPSAASTSAGRSSSASASASGSASKSRPPTSSASTPLHTGAASQNKDNMVGAVIAAAAAVYIL